MLSCSCTNRMKYTARHLQSCDSCLTNSFLVVSECDTAVYDVSVSLGYATV